MDIADRRGAFRLIVEVLTADLPERGGLDLREAFMGGGFAPAKKGDAVGRIMAGADTAGLPAAARLARAPQHEVKLAEAALDSLFLKEMFCHIFFKK